MDWWTIPPNIAIDGLHCRHRFDDLEVMIRERIILWIWTYHRVRKNLNQENKLSDQETEVLNNCTVIKISVTRDEALPTEVGSYELSRTGLPDNDGDMLH